MTITPKKTSVLSIKQEEDGTEVLKRLKACYEINIIKKYYNEDNENYLINARDILKHVIKQNEYYISHYMVRYRL